MSEAGDKVVGVVVADLERAAIGTRSRLGEDFGERAVIGQVVERLLGVAGVAEVAVLAPSAQHDLLWRLIGPADRVRVMALEPRGAGIEARVRAGRAWNLLAWRGGAGQWTVFDEEYHPGAIARAAGELGAGHVLVVHSHGVFLDVGMTGALVHHHLHKNHEMRVTYTPAAPGLCGMVLRGDIVREMGEKSAMPGQLLSYDPKSPTFDTLIREACMQVDPAISKIPNRFCVDTQRAWGICREMQERGFGSSAELCVGAARGVAPGVVDLSRVFEFPREVEIELTGRRMTAPPGVVPEEIRMGRGELDAGRWVGWLGRQREELRGCDDLLVTFAGDGDPLLYEGAGGMIEILRAAREAGVLGICLQTDLAGDIGGLMGAIEEGLVDVISVTMYGQTAGTYARVGGVAEGVHGVVMQNMQRLAAVTRGRGGVPVVVPRLLKTRETLPEMEAFFDTWVEAGGWAVIDGPTDRAGGVPFAAVVDMGPPKRRPCRRLWDRLLIRCDGTATACDQDMAGKLRLGNIESMSLHAMWRALNPLREMHAAGRWNEVVPCNGCREWHRA